MSVSDEFLFQTKMRQDSKPQILLIAFVVAVFLLPCLSFGQWFPKREFDVLNTETLKFHPARVNKEGTLIVYGETSMLFSSQIIEDEQTSKFQRFTVLNHVLLKEQSIVKTKNQYHQIEQVLRTSSGEIYIQAKTLFDQEDNEAYHNSPKGTFLHPILIPIGEVTAYQSRPSHCEGIGTLYVKSEDPQEASEWAQAILVNQQNTLEEDRMRRESRWGTADLRYMKKVACLSNGEKVLSEKQTKRIQITTTNKEVEADVFEFISPSGQSTLAFSPGEFWQTADEIQDQSKELWAFEESDLESQRQRASR